MSAPRQEALQRLRQAAALQREGRHAAALPLLREALALDPAAAELHRALGEALADCGRYAEAVDAFAAALQRAPRDAHELHLHRAVLFADHLRRDAEAEAELKAALACAPGYLPALMNLGNLHEQRGDRSAALDCYARALREPAFAAPSMAPLRAVALARSAVIQPPATLDDPALDALRAALADPQVDLAARVHLYFTLGHALDRLGAIDPAFEAFALGNRSLLRLHGRRYRPQHEEALTAALMRAFDRPAAGPSLPGAGPLPLFICGMFRSGSTLLEQVLAAHPRVVAGGEVDWLLRLAAERMAPFPASAHGLDASRAAALGAEYRAHLSQLFPQAGSESLVTDKRPDNFQIIGLIKRLLPGAKIIHTTRHPLDNGLSVFMQHMNTDVTPYATDLADIGHYYGQYRRLMAHWKSLYPEDIFDFDYDAFVRSPEGALRPLLAFLGLPWEQRCLDFHQLRNTVKTASYWQVRRPLYADASGRWQRYLPHLQPLRSALQAAGVTLDADAV